jgi:hypothetical protein
MAHTQSPFAWKEIAMKSENIVVDACVPWNKGKLAGQKRLLKLREIWSIRTRLQIVSHLRELAQFNLAIEANSERVTSCGCWFRMSAREAVASRATIMQQKTQRSVQFEITQQTRESLEAWIEARGLRRPIFCSRAGCMGHRIYRRSNMPGWYIAGFHRSALSIPHTEPVRCAAQRLH